MAYRLWHSHDAVSFGMGGSGFVELDDLDIIVGLACGDLLVVSHYGGGS